MPGNNKAPGLASEGSSEKWISTPSGLHPIDPLDAVAAYADGTFGVVVKATGGRYRRRCFLSAALAERQPSGPQPPVTMRSSTWRS